MSKKATHYGTCQACGAHQKLPNGKLSNHGYTAKYGFHEGTCPGSNMPPYEKSYKYIETCISNAISQINDIEEEMFTIRMDKAAKTVHTIMRIRVNRQYMWTNGVVENGYFVHSTGKESMRKYTLYGTDLDIADQLRERRIDYLKRRINSLNDYIKWQEERIENWQEQELKKVS